MMAARSERARAECPASMSVGRGYRPDLLRGNHPANVWNDSTKLPCEGDFPQANPVLSLFGELTCVAETELVVRNTPVRNNQAAGMGRQTTPWTRATCSRRPKP